LGFRLLSCPSSAIAPKRSTFAPSSANNSLHRLAPGCSESDRGAAPPVTHLPKETTAYLCWPSGSSVLLSHRTVTPQLPRVSTMDAKTQRPKDREGAISALNAAVEVLNLIKEAASVTPAKAAFGSVSMLLTMIRVCLVLVYSDGLQAHKCPGLHG